MNIWDIRVYWRKTEIKNEKWSCNWNQHGSCIIRKNSHVTEWHIGFLFSSVKRLINMTFINSNFKDLKSFGGDDFLRRLVNDFWKIFQQFKRFILLQRYSSFWFFQHFTTFNIQGCTFFNFFEKVYDLRLFWNFTNS